MSEQEPVYPDQPEWLSGHFLISDANLSDPNFHRTVVLIVSHDENGALGLVVNRRLEATLTDVLPEFSDTDAGALPLYEGGPVQKNFLFMLYSGIPGNLRSEHAIDPLTNITFEPAFSSELSDYLQSEWCKLEKARRPLIHLYVGYSGWASGQLEHELQHDAWIVRPAASKHVFSSSPEEGWREALGELGGLHKIVAETGYKPSMN